jgi:hypothetical protein
MKGSLLVSMSTAYIRKKLLPVLRFSGSGPGQDVPDDQGLPQEQGDQSAQQSGNDDNDDVSGDTHGTTNPLAKGL